MRHPLTFRATPVQKKLVFVDVSTRQIRVEMNSDATDLAQNTENETDSTLGLGYPNFDFHFITKRPTFGLFWNGDFLENANFEPIMLTCPVEFKEREPISLDFSIDDKLISYQGDASFTHIQNLTKTDEGFLKEYGFIPSNSFYVADDKYYFPIMVHNYINTDYVSVIKFLFKYPDVFYKLPTFLEVAAKIVINQEDILERGILRDKHAATILQSRLGELIIDPNNADFWEAWTYHNHDMDDMPRLDFSKKRFLNVTNNLLYNLGKRGMPRDYYIFFLTLKYEEEPSNVARMREQNKLDYIMKYASVQELIRILSSTEEGKKDVREAALEAITVAAKSNIDSLQKELSNLTTSTDELTQVQELVQSIQKEKDAGWGTVREKAPLKDRPLSTLQRAYYLTKNWRTRGQDKSPTPGT